MPMAVVRYIIYLDRDVDFAETIGKSAGNRAACLIKKEQVRWKS